MRRMISTIFLLSALAHAQTATPLTQEAKASPVSYPFSAAKASAPAAAPAPAPKVSVVPRAAFRDVVTGHLNTDIEDFADLHTATISYRLGADTAASPKLVHVVGREVPADFRPDHDARVSVRMVVDQRGVPTDVKIVHSAGAVLDESTLEAVNQYRFRPATLNSVPVESDVTLDIALVKK